MANSQILTRAQDYYAAWNDAWEQDDFDQVASRFIADDCEFVCGQGKLREGKEGFLNLVAEARPVMMIVNDIERMTAEGNTVTTEYVSHLNFTEEARRKDSSLPATFDVRHPDVMKFADDQIVGGRTYNHVSTDDVVGHGGPFSDMSPVGNFGYTNFSDRNLKTDIIAVRW